MQSSEAYQNLEKKECFNGWLAEISLLVHNCDEDRREESKHVSQRKKKGEIEYDRLVLPIDH